ncbi:MAG: sulfurtransferase TusA family protein [Mariprofundaceae bacterium]|nr:sulfurtransferase TusA family protein [Mariprofundaceae bacterium]
MSDLESFSFASEDDLRDYEAGLNAFRQGSMSEERFTPFRLQMGIYGQRQDGVQMIRVKLPAGKVSAEQFDVMAELIDSYGGHLDADKVTHITTRQDLQINFVLLDDTPAILRKLADVGLTTREACGNTVRNVTSCFLSGVCPSEHVDVSKHAEMFANYFLRHPLAQQFPRKFKVNFSGCNTDCAMSGMHDIGFIATHLNGKAGFKVMAAGGLSTQPVRAIVLEDFIEETEVLLVGEALMRVHFKYSDRKRRARARMKYVLLQLGEDGFRAEYRKQRAVVEKTHLQDQAPVVAWREPSEGLNTDEFPLVNQHDGQQSLILNVFRGDLSASQCRAISEAARLGETQDIRVTPEQGVVVRSIHPQLLAKVKARLAQDDLHSEHARTLSDITACPGVESCRLAITSSRGLAQTLRDDLKIVGEAARLNDLKVKISGCQHSCGQHHVADLGFHGLVRKVAGQSVPHYQLHIGGSGRAEESFGFATKPIPAKHAPQAGMAILEAYNQASSEYSSIYAWADAQGSDAINAILEPFAADAGEVEGLLYDWSENQPFSTKGNKKGECAGAVLSMTDALLSESEYELMQAKAHLDAMFWAEADAALKRSVITLARAFLVPHGEAPEENAQVVGILSKASSQDEDVMQGLDAIHYALLGVDLSEPQTGVMALRDACIAWFELASKRFAAVPEVTEQADVVANEETVSTTDDIPLLDLKGVACPMNFVKTKLRLATMAVGSQLRVILDDGAPIENVPRSLDEQGQKVLEQTRQDDGQWCILVERVH